MDVKFGRIIAVKNPTLGPILYDGIRRTRTPVVLTRFSEATASTLFIGNEDVALYKAISRLAKSGQPYKYTFDPDGWIA